MKKIQIRFENSESIPEELRDFYAEQEDGTFILQAESDASGLGIGNIASLRGKLDKAIAKHEKQQALLLEKEDGTLWTKEELDVMQGEVDSLRKAVQDAAGGSKDLEQEIQLRTTDLKRAHTEQMQKIKGEADRLRKFVNETAVDREVAKVMGEMRVKPEWTDLLSQELKRHIQVEEVNGTIQTRFVNPDDGSVRYSSSMVNDGPMDYKEFSKLADVRNRYAQCLEGDGKMGATEMQRGGNNGRDVILSAEEYGDFATFQRAKAIAEKQGGQVLMKD